MSDIHAGRIEALRGMMRSRGYDAVIIPGSDPHGSEYLSPRWKQVEWLSGFTGEAADMVVTLDHAGLWTDSRYFIQAVRQLEGSGVELHKTRVAGEIPIPQWLSGHDFGPGETVIAMDGLCQSISSVEAIKEAMQGKACIIADVPDLLEPLWDGRPEIPCSRMEPTGEELTGSLPERKLSLLRDRMEASGIDAVFLTALDDIAWMLDVRGGDIEYNPLIISYLLVTMDEALWYVRKGPLAEDDSSSGDIFRALERQGISVLGYDEAAMALSGLSDTVHGKLLVDPDTLSYSLLTALQEAPDGDIEIVRGPSPVREMKAVKNVVEIENMAKAHLLDGVAMERFLHWLDNELSEGRTVDEYGAALRLHALRSEGEGYRGESFETISAYGENAALPHYHTPTNGGAKLERRGLYLVDSGGQYIYGTTDITRTVPLGPCTEVEREDYTLVMKGHIGLAAAVFPEGTPGCRIDALAREPLWKHLRNYGHGTGHGVGYWLCVHEGPQDIRQNLNPQPLLPGMVVSDEPGIYREGEHGVRHENLLLTEPAGENGFGRWMKFRTLTLCHFDTKAIVPGLLTQDEKDWLNAYNEMVFNHLEPLLPRETALWLRSRTLPIG